MLRIAKDTWQSKKIHQNVYIRKSEKHLVMQKGSWFKVNIQKVGKCGMYWNLIDISIYVLYNSFFFLYSWTLFLIYGDKHGYLNHIKTLHTFVCDYFIFVFFH